MLNLKKLLTKILRCCYKEETIVKSPITWTCKTYPDGWFEAVGVSTGFTLSSYINIAAGYGYYKDFDLPVTMANADYYAHAVWIIGNGFAWEAGGMSRTTTVLRLYALGSLSGSQTCNIKVHLVGKRVI